LSGKISDAKITEVVTWVGLKDRIHHRVGTYSHGMRQRLGLAQALLPEPEFLLLDEPTDGLDPEGIVEFRSRVLELRDRLNLTVLLSSHLLAEVAQICDKVVILRQGQLVFDGPLQQLAGQRSIFRIKANNATAEEIAVAAASFGGRLIPGGEISFPAEVSGDKLLHFLITEKKLAVAEFSPKSDSLESMYLELNQRPPQPAA
jgi:ABC-2 type transport system ATP-binding protein